MHVVTLKVVLSRAERHECKGYQKQFNTRWGLTLIFHDNNIVVLQEGKNKYLLARRATSLRVCACLKNARIELMYGLKFIMNMIIKQSPLVQIIRPVLLLLPLGVIQAFPVSGAGMLFPLKWARFGEPRLCRADFCRIQSQILSVVESRAMKAAQGVPEVDAASEQH